jgi:hypothetical protein
MPGAVPCLPLYGFIACCFGTGDCIFMVLYPRENSLNFNLDPFLVIIVTKSLAGCFHRFMNINLLNEVKDLYLKFQSYPSFRIILIRWQVLCLLKSELR